MPRSTPFMTLCLVLPLMAACAEFPEVGMTATAPTALPPRLLPIDGILVQADSIRPVGAVVGGVQARAAALRARADRLRRM